MTTIKAGMVFADNDKRNGVDGGKGPNRKLRVITTEEIGGKLYARCESLTTGIKNKVRADRLLDKRRFTLIDLGEEKPTLSDNDKELLGQVSDLVMGNGGMTA